MPTNLLSPEYGLSNSKLDDCTATASDVLKGKTFYSGDKTKKTGTLSFSGNVSEGQVRQGYTFYSNSTTKKTGTLQYLGREPKAAGLGTNNSRLYVYIGEILGSKDWIVNRGVYATFGDVAKTIGLTADKIKSGQQILGITGSFNGNAPNFMNIDARPGWGEGSIWTSSSIWAPSNARVTFRIRMYSEYNVDGFVRVLKNGAEVAASQFNKDSTTYFAKTFSGSGNYSLNVRIDYHAGNGTIQLGGNIVTW